MTFWHGAHKHAPSRACKCRPLSLAHEVEHPDTLNSMNNLAAAYRALARHQEALALQERVLEAHTRVLGTEHPDTLRMDVTP